VVKASFTASDAVKEAFTPLRTVLNDAFGTFNVLNAPFRTSQQPDTFALPLKTPRNTHDPGAPDVLRQP